VIIRFSLGSFPFLWVMYFMGVPFANLGSLAVASLFANESNGGALVVRRIQECEDSTADTS
jgi:hypothetical protein